MAGSEGEGLNPFQAPASAIGPGGEAAPEGEAVAIRRAYVRHEAALRSLGLLGYLGAVLWGILLVSVAGRLLRFTLARGSPNPAVVGRMVGYGGLALVLGVCYGGVGFGLRRLQPWSRWMVLILTATILLVIVGLAGWLAWSSRDSETAGMHVGRFLIPTVIVSYVLNLVASSKGAMVFSPAYRQVVQATPELNPRTNWIIKILLGLLVVLVLVGAVLGVA